MRTQRPLFSSPFVGAAAGFGTTVIGNLVGSALEGPLGGPIVSWEFAPLVAGLYATVGGALVGPLAKWGGTWRRGLMIGTGVHALIFGVLLILSIGKGHPRAVLCWITVTGILAGAIAGLLCGTRAAIVKKCETNRSNGDNGQQVGVC